MEAAVGGIVVAVLGLFAAFFVGVALLVRAAYRRNKARVGALAAYCQANGLTYTEHDPYGLHERWPGIPFGRGSMRAARNVVTGAFAGHALVAFDYSFSERDMDGDSSTSAYGVVVLRMPGPLPDLMVSPESFVTRIAHKLGKPDVKLGDPVFDRAWDVRGADPGAAAYLMTPAVRAHLMAYGSPVVVRTVGADLVSWGALLDPVELPRRAALLAALAGAFPPART